MKKLLLLSAALVGAITFVSCSDDNTENSANNTTPAINSKDMQFIVASGDPKSDLTGGVYMKVFSDLATTKSNQTIYGDSTNGVRSLDGFTQYVYNPNTGVYSGFIYARAASAQGIGSSQPGIRSYKVRNGKLVELANSPVKIDNFGNTGYFGNYTYSAQISNPYVERVDSTGAGKNIAVGLPNYAIDETNPTIGNIIDLGNNQVAMVLNYSNRDSAVVAFCDYDLNIKKVIYDGRIGNSVGALRSVRYAQSAMDDDGNIYVFSGSSATDSKVGALRINKGAETFDSSYKFNILSKSDGYRFRKVFHISGDKFLLEFYLSTTAYGVMDVSGKYAIADMGDQTLTWVTGLPDLSKLSVGWGDGYDGAYYIPVAAGTDFAGGSGSHGGGGSWTRATEYTVPTIYRIDANTAIATPFMTFGTGDLLKSILITK